MTESMDILGRQDVLSTEYELLRAGQQKVALRGKCALAIMAKAPRAGKVKTRLAPALTLEGSAAINICFLRDTARNIADSAAGSLAEGLVCYTPAGEESAFNGLLPREFKLILQRGDGFGHRLLAAAEDILSCGFESVCLIDSDSPTLPGSALRQAVEELSKPGDRIVLGPSADGGYYLIGMKRAHAVAFERISWSTSTVLDETMERINEAGIAMVELPLWYDVDDAITLAVLERELLLDEPPTFAQVQGYDARSTRAFLAERLRAQDAGALATKPSQKVRS